MITFQYCTHIMSIMQLFFPGIHNSVRKLFLNHRIFQLSEGIIIIIIIFKFIYLFTYLWLCWVFVSVRGLSLVVASGGHSSLWCAGLSAQASHYHSLSCCGAQAGSRRAGSVTMAHGPSCSVACGIFPDQGLNPSPLHWQADSQPLRHQGSPEGIIIYVLLRPIIFNRNCSKM